MERMRCGAIGAALATLPLGAAQARPNADDLAAQFANPVAALIGVPFQNNFDFGGGTGDAFRYTMNFQPVVPITLGPDWNLILRTILPVMDAERVFPDHRTGGWGTSPSPSSSPPRGRYFAEAPDGGPDWGIHVNLTFVFPK